MEQKTTPADNRQWDNSIKQTRLGRIDSRQLSVCIQLGRLTTAWAPRTGRKLNRNTSRQGNATTQVERIKWRWFFPKVWSQLLPFRFSHALLVYSLSAFPSFNDSLSCSCTNSSVFWTANNAAKFRTHTHTHTFHTGTVVLASPGTNEFRMH